MKQKIKKFIESIFVVLGSIHAEGRDITHKDLDQIKEKKANELLGIIEHKHDPQDWPELRFKRGGHVRVCKICKCLYLFEEKVVTK